MMSITRPYANIFSLEEPRLRECCCHSVDLDVDQHHGYLQDQCLLHKLVLDEEGNYENGNTEEETELAAAQYKYSVRQLANAFPKVELDVAALAKGVPCNDENSEPCECGEGRCGVFPWEVWTEELGYCKCELAVDREFDLVDAWITGYAPDGKFAY